jgi:hypothetical protein
MGYKSWAIRPFAGKAAKHIERTRNNAVKDQQKWFEHLIKRGSKTLFGKDHGFTEIKTPADYAARVPIRDYEELKPYVEKIIEGRSNVLWPGKPRYFAKTSGTTSGVKYIPITKDSIPNHMQTARRAVFNYAHIRGQHQIFDGKVIFLSGSPTLDKTGGIATGRLSGIVNHEIPTWLQGNQLPSYKTNCIEEWEDKVIEIVRETKDQDMRLISGIPPWVQMYFEKLLETTGAGTVNELFPNFQLFVYGGVNYEPYRPILEQLMGRNVDSLETYPASEGFIAFQDQFPSEGLLLNTNSGIWLEFVPLNQISSPHPDRIGLRDVVMGEDYVVVVNNNAGLWAYNLGDTVRFVSLKPYRVIVSGRVKHFISAFGEHVIGSEVEKAMQKACVEYPCQVTEFTVAPQITPPGGGLPYHEWLVEFAQPPTDLAGFAKSLDEAMTKQNIYYKDLIDGKILQPLKVTQLPPDGFRDYMRSQGKLGGQNKVPRLTNDRRIADALKGLLSG